MAASRQGTWAVRSARHLCIEKIGLDGFCLIVFVGRASVRRHPAFFGKGSNVRFVFSPSAWFSVRSPGQSPSVPPTAQGRRVNGTARISRRRQRSEIFLWRAVSEALEERRLLTGYAIYPLANFDGSNGSGTYPVSGLVMDAAGNLYGTTLDGGPDGLGTIFKVAAGGGATTTLATFNSTNGAYPSGELVMDSAGNLYGTTAGGGDVNGDGTVFELASGSSIITTVAAFDGTDGSNPQAGLIVDSAGNLYGTALAGGDDNGDGTVFEVVNGSTAITLLANFNGSNGSNPYGGMTIDTAGNLYGTTASGGDAEGDGTVFELAKGSTTITLLASFNGSNGSAPLGNVILDTAGNLYGTTSFGGDASGDGTVFMLASSSTITTLAEFNGTDGSSPDSLIMDSAGNFVGTTFAGGDASGDGTVFEILAHTTAVTTLADFDENSGSGPNGLIMDSAGNLYGTANYGGEDYSGDGTVFEASPSASTAAVEIADSLSPQLPASLDFPATPISSINSTPATGEFYLTNTGGAPLNITNFAQSGTNPGDYTVSVEDNDGNPVLGDSFTVPAGDTYTISVAFLPLAAGPSSANITFNTNDVRSADDAISLSLTGTGGVPQLLVADLPTNDLITFPATAAGSPSAPQTFMLDNVGSAPLNVSGFGLGGNNAADFSVTVDDNYGNPVTGPSFSIPANSAYQVTVTFIPNGLNLGPTTASLTFATNDTTDPGAASVALTLDGTALAAPDPFLITSTQVYSNIGGDITDVALNLNIVDIDDSDLTVSLVSPAGTTVQLFQGVGGQNFTGTTLDSQAPFAATIGSASTAAPYTGRFSPAASLAAFNGEDPNGTWTLLIARTANSGTLENWSLTIQTPVQTSTDVPQSISNEAVTSTLTVTGFAGNIADLTVALDIADLPSGAPTITLTSPYGTTITLIDQVGNAGDSFTGTVLDDAAGVPITSATAPFTGAFMPVNPLSAFDGQSADGTWTLKIIPTASSSLPAGMLNAWSLDITQNTAVDVRGNGLSIPSGDTTPRSADATDFGASAGGVVIHTFVIYNPGPATLDLSSSVDISGPNAADFVLTTPPGASVPAGDSTTFTITYTPTAAGIESASVSIPGAGPAPYTFDVSGAGINPVIGVMGSTFIGGVRGTGSTADFFTITNNGSDPLDITGVQIIPNSDAVGLFSVSQPGQSVLAYGEQTTIVVTFTVSSLITYQNYGATLEITSNDPITPTFSSTVMAVAAAPFVRVPVGSGEADRNGEYPIQPSNPVPLTAPTAADLSASVTWDVSPSVDVPETYIIPFGTGAMGTGPVALNSPQLVETFTITNTSASDPLNFTIEQGSVPAGFSIVTNPTVLAVPTGHSATFSVALLTASAGTFGGQIVIIGSDPESASGAATGFQFGVMGTVVSAPVFTSFTSFPRISYATASTTLSGNLASGISAPSGATVDITVNGVTDPATVGANGNFSLPFDTASLPAGSYPITYQFAGSAAFAAATATGTLTVTPAKPTITWTTPGAITYGAKFSAVSKPTSSVPGTFTYTAMDGLGGVIVAGTANTILDAGAEILIATFTPSSAADYSSATATVTLTVNKAVLTVTADSESRVYGAANPALAYTLSGPVTGSLSGAPSLSTTATSTKAPGIYPITVVSVGTLFASNYTFKVGSGSELTIKQATTTVSLSASIVTGQSLTLTATIAPVSPGAGTPTGTVTFMSGKTVIGKMTISKGKAILVIKSLAKGTYTITATYSGDANFAGLTSVAQVVKVTQVIS